MKILKVDTDTEEKILCGLILSDSFCMKILPMITTDVLKIKYSATVVKWIREFYENHKKAPKSTMQQIYSVKKDLTQPDEYGLIGMFIQSLSDRTELNAFNFDYFAEKAVRYIKTVSLKKTVEMVDYLLGENKVEEAEEFFIKSGRQTLEETSEWVTPLRESEVINYFIKKDEDVIFTPFGALGNLIGPLSREWYVVFSAGFKRGKTWLLWEFCVQALIQQVPTVMFSFEMGVQQQKERLYKVLCGGDGYHKEVLIPVLDCYRNQDQSCTDPNRCNRIKLSAKPKEPIPGYKVCTLCRENNPQMFIPVVYYERRKKEFDMNTVLQKVRASKYSFGELLKIKSFPMGSGATVSQIEKSLDYLETTEGFTPSLLIYDYLDIAGKENNRDVGRDVINNHMIAMKGMAQRRKVLLLTCTQVNRGGLGVRDLGEENTADDIRKLAHPDVYGVLNVTPEEKRRGMARFAVLDHRHRFCDPQRQALILQQLKWGQPMLDSELVYHTLVEDGGEDSDEES